MTAPLRKMRWFDNWLIGCQRFLSVLPGSSSTANRPSPAESLPESVLSRFDQSASAKMMRVNHAGEICAQALYWGQSLTTQDQHLRQVFTAAAQEEFDHLHWCAQRLKELNSHQSYLNPLWFCGSFLIGATAGLIGDKWSLGFLAETENQVFNHLQTHLTQLPPEDEKSRTILLQMQQEEAQHATHAMTLGAVELPSWVKGTMRLMAKCMTSVTYYV